MTQCHHVLATVVIALIAMGCGSAISTTIANPARVGQIQSHALVRADRNGEGTGFGARLAAAAAERSTTRLPAGALDDAVRLVRFDEAGICFDLLARHTSASPIDYRNGIQATLVHQPTGAAAPTVPTIVASRPRGHAEVAQTDIRVRDGWTSGCEDGECWSHATYRNQAQDVSARVYESRSLFCFANDGSFDPATTALELTLPNGQFKWEFDGPATSWARPVITMESAYVAPTDRLLGRSVAPRQVVTPVATVRPPAPTVRRRRPVARPRAPRARARIVRRRARSERARRRIRRR